MAAVLDRRRARVVAIVVIVASALSPGVVMAWMSAVWAVTNPVPEWRWAGSSPSPVPTFIWGLALVPAAVYAALGVHLLVSGIRARTPLTGIAGVAAIVAGLLTTELGLVIVGLAHVS